MKEEKIMKGLVEITYVRVKGVYEVWYWANNWDCLMKGQRKTLQAARNLAHKFGTIYKESEI